MQTRIGVELSSPTRLIRYRLFYRREILLLSGFGVSAQVGGAAWWVGVLDSPCGGIINGFLVWHLSFCSRYEALTV